MHSESCTASQLISELVILRCVSDELRDDGPRDPVRPRTSSSQKRTPGRLCGLLGGLNGLPRGVTPRTQRRHIGGTEGCGSVYPGIRGDRHVALLDLPADLDEDVLGRVGVHCAPVREVPLLAGLADVSDEQPRRWRDAGIPGPRRLVAVAV